MVNLTSGSVAVYSSGLYLAVAYPLINISPADPAGVVFREIPIT
ncbi:MAG: hypothetical protein ACTSQK_10510 [Candidatus Heimdallarchaeota archaeon]